MIYPEEGIATVAVGRLHGAGVVEVAVRHDPLDILGMADVLGRIMVLSNHDEVGKLSGLQGTEIDIESDVFGSIERATTKRF